MVFPYSFLILLRERSRYFPAVLAVTFSAVLVIMQVGLLMGFLAVSAKPVERVPADLWAASPDIVALGYSHPIDEAWWARLASEPEVAAVEPYLFGFTLWHKPDKGLEQCYIVGSRLDDDSIGALRDLSPDDRRRLARPGTVAVYDPDRTLLGLKRGVGEVAEVNRQRVEVVAVLGQGGKGSGLVPGVFCSLRTARSLLPEVGEGQVTYFIARCHNPAQRAGVAKRLRRAHPDMTVLSCEELSGKTQSYWLTKTRAGLVLTFAALLGLLTGAVITSQTLYSATAAFRRELAVLRALGIPRWRVVGLVLAQSLQVALIGVSVAVPLAFGLVRAGLRFGIEVLVPLELLGAVGGLTVVTALLSGLVALRSLRLAEPIDLLR